MKFDKEELTRKIREAESLSNEEKSALLGLLNEKKTYGLVWEEKTEDAFEQLKSQLPILREVKERQIVNDTDSEHYPNHILIEGDNLQALVALTYTHAGMIDVIYIDPPYNTGKEDFIYNDKFVDKDDEYKHSKWLSFMKKRLKIAKTLLSEKGVIFISIDDNEQANLKVLCNDVFGNENFTGQLIIKTATDNNPSQINTEHEYMLCYCANKSAQNNWERTSQAAKDIIEKYREIKEQGLTTQEIQKELRKWIRANKANLPQVAHYNNVDEKGVHSSSGNSSNPHPGDYMYDIYHPITHKACPKPQNGWRWPLATFEEYNKQGEIEWGKDETTQPHVKKRIETSTEYLRTLIYEDNRGTTLALAEMFNGEKVFDNPKPIRVISKVIDFTTNKNSIILDFFAGSGTTLHTTMRLNAEDGGCRQCILVTNNENSICENVTYERNKRVIEGYTTPKDEHVDGLKKNNLRYYKVDFKERKQSHQSNRNLAMDLKDLLCIKEGIYTEQKQFGALSLSGKEQMIRYFAEENRGMLMVYNTRVIPFITKEIEKMDLKEHPLKVYIFADGAYPYTDDFASVIDKVSLIPMPYAFHRAIKDVLPEEDDIRVDDTKLTSNEQKEMMAEAIEAENNEKKED